MPDRRPPVLALLTLAAVGPFVPAPLASRTVVAQRRTAVNVGFVAYNALSWPFWAAQAVGSFGQEGRAVDAATYVDRYSH